MGEAWLSATGAEAVAIGTEGEARRLEEIEHAGGRGFPVLVKLLFTEEPLSVQVHPDDEWAGARGLGNGKTEAWYVIAARPDAQIGVGLKPEITLDAFAEACHQGRGAQALAWRTVNEGEMILVPAGTIHAIGAGLVICEVQQQSDLTFRLDDYGRLGSDGRPRALHLREGLEATRMTQAGAVAHGLGEAGSGRLLAHRYFSVHRWVMRKDEEVQVPAQAGGQLWVNVSLPPREAIRMESVEGGERRAFELGPGEAILMTGRSEPMRMTGAGCVLAIDGPAD